MTTPQPPASQPTSDPSPLASWGPRAIGFIIDNLPMIILYALAIGSAGLRAIVGLIGLGYTIYLGYLDGVTGQTPGKAMQGIRLVNDKGDLIGAGAAIGRKFVHILDSMVCLLGWFLPIVDAKRQTIADKLMQTFVVSGAEKRPFSVDLWMAPQQQSGE